MGYRGSETPRAYLPYRNKVRWNGLKMARLRERDQGLVVHSRQGA